MTKEHTLSSKAAIEIQATQLSDAALKGLVEEFVTRDGTDYGERERSLTEKVADVHEQLDRGEAKIWFDPESETVTIRLADDEPAPEDDDPEP